MGDLTDLAVWETPPSRKFTAQQDLCCLLIPPAVLPEK